MAAVAFMQDDAESPLADDDSNEDNDQMSSASSGEGGSTGSPRRATKPPVDPAAGSFAIESSTETGRQHQKAKRYRHTAAKGSANPASGPSSALTSQQKASPTKRRIMRKDRRATLEMLTSDDDVNEYRGARPSSYIEPAARRNLHEVKPHYKSSFETLYNPEYNSLAAEDSELPSLSLSSSSCNSADEGSMTGNYQAKKVKKIPEFWQTASGPNVSNPYLDVTQNNSDVREEGGKDQVDKSNSTQPEKVASFGAQNLDKPVLSFQRQNTNGALVEVDKLQEELNGTSRSELPSRPTNGDSEWAIAAKNQPLNVSIKVSKSSADHSASSPKGTTIGVDLEIALSQPVTVERSPPAQSEPTVSKQAMASAGSTFIRDSTDDKKPSETIDKWAKLPARLALLPDKVPPRRSPNPEPVDLSPQAATGQTSSAVVEKPRGRRVLPAVPDSADLEVSDLLRETQKSDTTDRPKSAVDILVAKNRPSSILQVSQPDSKSTSKVSQQLRLLFHNPSPLIMLQRAATRPILPNSLPTKAETIEFAQQQQANKYLPLRSSQQRADETPRSASAVLYPESPSQEALSQTGQGAAQPPPELPFRRNRSLLPNQRQAQQPEQQRPQSAAVFLQAAPPPVPPRQAKTSVARQHPPSTFYPSKVQLAVNHSSSTAPLVAARSLPESSQSLRQGTGVKARDGELQSVDQLYKRIQQLPDRSAKHTVIIDSSMDLNGSSGKYLFAAEASNERQQVAQQEYFPSRIKTNPHMGGRTRDSFTRRVELGDARGEEDASVANEINAASNLTTESSGVTRANARPMEDFIRRFGHLSQKRENDDDNIAKQPTARDRLFSDQTRADESTRPHETSKRNSNSVVQTAVSRMESRSNGASSLVSTPNDSTSSVSQLLAVRNGRGLRVPPNAVRVLPREDDELRERMRTLGGRSNGGRSPRPADDAVTGLEKMCRDMRLEDDGLLDGAERHDTSVQLQSRINALNSTAPDQPMPAREAPSNRGAAAERPYFVQHRGLFPFNRETDDQARRFQADSNRKHTATVKSAPLLRLVRETGSASSNDLKASAHGSISLTQRQPPQDQISHGNVSQHMQSAPPVNLLQPGEREEGPEIIL